MNNKPTETLPDGSVLYPMGRVVRKAGFSSWDIYTPIRNEDGEVDGSIYWKFREVERHKRKDLAAWMEVTLSRSGKEKTWSARGVLTSTSFRSDTVRTLDRMFPEKNLAEYLADAVNLLEAAMDSVGWDQGIDEAPPSREEHTLLGPFIAAGSPNLLFGDGGSCKTYISMGMMFALATGTPFLGYQPKKKVKSLFLDYENDLGKFRDRVYAIGASVGEPFDIDAVSTQIRYLNCSGGTVADRLPRIREIIEARGIDLVVVDSALGACGGTPESAETTGRYFEAINSLGVTTLTIAHVSRGAMDQENTMKGQMHSFGSIFWRNYPRATWNVQKLGDDEDGEKTKRIAMYHRKANDGPLHPMVPLEVDFANPGMVGIRVGKRSDWEDARPLSDRILAYLMRHGSSKRTDIERHLEGERPESIKTTLRRLRDRGKIRLIGGEGGEYALGVEEATKV